ncbi:LytR/AlgR family response regulator transcription factor [Aliidiomarina haloalkalitolerans]|uniref:HTH LytTR-type domain-containing protein n=1 Tax=Aliidiomarina haloalkalitolerans TaxID=859059 RepID=A0A432VRH7_9GAMM|nr:LytTR family DNA-binding domain-containing protein [Aliidiomarina haloalkalitolerans]RUO18922.1 hypothetical protein CWE06_10030 [Aliidiomarina haloalkalitolerans]
MFDIHQELFAAKSAPGIVEVIRLSNVSHIKASGNYVDFELLNGHVFHRMTLTRLKEQLPAHFIQVHRSFIINLAHLQRLQSELGRYTECVLTGGKTVPIGKQYRKMLLDLLRIDQSDHVD